MFDYTDRSSYTRVDVQQQPNDAADAARLYGEIETKVKSRIITACTIETNMFKGKAFVFERVEVPGTMFKMVFDLNGKRFEVDHLEEKDYISSEYEARKKAFQALIDKVNVRISEEITFELIEPLFAQRLYI